MPQNIAQMSDDLRDRDLREYLDRPEEPGMEADVLTEEGVGGKPSQQKPPMSLDCWNRLYWFFEIYLPGAGK